MEMSLLTDAKGVQVLCCRLGAKECHPLPLATIYEQLDAHRRDRPGLERILIDLRGLRDFNFAKEEGRHIRDTWQWHPADEADLRTAILVDNDLMFGLCRMYHTLVHEAGDCLTICREPAAAATWLGLTDAAIPRRTGENRKG